MYRVVDVLDCVTHKAFYQPSTRQDTGQHQGYLEVTQRAVFGHFVCRPLRKKASKRPFPGMLFSFNSARYVARLVDLSRLPLSILKTDKSGILNRKSKTVFYGDLRSDRHLRRHLLQLCPVNRKMHIPRPTSSMPRPVLDLHVAMLKLCLE